MRVFEVGDRVRLGTNWFYTKSTDANHPIVGDTGKVIEANPDWITIKVQFDRIEKPWQFNPDFFELESRNEFVLKMFVNYCQTEGKDLRFWQALRNWSGYSFIYASESAVGDLDLELMDTFSWEGRRAPELRPLTTEERLKAAQDRVQQLERWLNEAATELGGCDLDQVTNAIRSRTGVFRKISDQRMFELKTNSVSGWPEPVSVQNSTAQVPGNTRR